MIHQPILKKNKNQLPKMRQLGGLTIYFGLIEGSLLDLFHICGCQD